MTRPPADPDALLLNLLKTADSLTMEEAVASLPEVSWSELFHAVDRLSRRGAIVLQRRGFDYLIAAPRSPCTQTPLASSACLESFKSTPNRPRAGRGLRVE